MNIFIRIVVTLAALVSTGWAEFHLANFLGWNTYVAVALPLVLDLYLVYSVRTGKDVPYAVATVIAVSATSYTLTEPLTWYTAPRIAISAIAPLILWRLEATARQETSTQVATPPVAAPPVIQRETVMVPHPVAHYVPVTLDKTELASLAASLVDEAEAVTQDAADETPETPAPRLSDTDARRRAEDAYAAGVSARAAAPVVTRSHATVNRWYKEFEEQGVRKLVTTK